MARAKNNHESMERIAKAAKRLFAKKGYANASLDEIASLAGFSKGAVYHFFGSKEALLLTLLSDIEVRSIGRTVKLLEGQPGGAMERLLRFKTLQSEWAVKNPDDLAILIWVSIESANRKSAVRDQIVQIYAHMETSLTQILEDGKASGEFAPTLPVQDVVTWLISVHDGNMLLWYRSGRNKEVGRSLTLASLQAARMAVTLQPLADPLKDVAHP